MAVYFLRASLYSMVYASPRVFALNLDSSAAVFFLCRGPVVRIGVPDEPLFRSSLDDASQSPLPPIPVPLYLILPC